MTTTNNIVCVHASVSCIDNMDGSNVTDLGVVTKMKYLVSVDVMECGNGSILIPVTGSVPVSVRNWYTWNNTL